MSDAVAAKPHAPHGVQVVLRAGYPTRHNFRWPPVRAGHVTSTMLTARWGARRADLAARGWVPACTPSTFAAMANCTSPSRGATQQSRFCHRAICPYCWAREVLSRWQDLDGFLFPGRHAQRAAIRPVASPRGIVGTLPARRRAMSFDVVVRHVWLPLRRTGDSDFLAHYLGDHGGRHPHHHTRRQTLALLLRAGAVGGFEVLQIAPEQNHGLNLATDWWPIARITTIAIVPCAKTKAFLADPVVRCWARSQASRRKLRIRTTVTTWKTLTRRKLVACVGNALRYARGLLDGPADLVFKSLVTSENRKLIVAFGCLYGRPPRRSASAL